MPDNALARMARPQVGKKGVEARVFILYWGEMIFYDREGILPTIAT